MAVRAAAATDIPALLALMRAYWDFEGIANFTAPRSTQLLQELLASEDLGAVWVSECAGALTGYLIVVWVLSIEHQGLMGEVDEFFVREAERSAGAGAALLGIAESWLKERGGVRLQLQLAAGNERARAFYERHGYAPRTAYELWDKAL